RPARSCSHPTYSGRSPENLLRRPPSCRAKSVSASPPGPSYLGDRQGRVEAEMSSRLATVLRSIRHTARTRGRADPSDAQLLRQFVARRDEGAFAALLERHGRLVLAVCRRVLRNPTDAEDAFQGTFLVLARKAGSVRDPQALAAWLYRVALNLCRTI